jgi:catechol 2,3-dioxygenase-like lactoylglutathione lyase family enzyme
MAHRLVDRRLGLHGTRRNHGLTTTFEQLDFVYMPSADVAADVRWFTDVLGARLVFAVEEMGTRVAMVELTDSPPRVLLAGHLEGAAPVLVYRVADLDQAVAELESRGFKEGTRLEIPHGPVCSFEAPGGQRLAVYELARPDVEAHFEGRRDF